MKWGDRDEKGFEWPSFGRTNRRRKVAPPASTREKNTSDEESRAIRKHHKDKNSTVTSTKYDSETAEEKQEGIKNNRGVSTKESATRAAGYCRYSDFRTMSLCLSAVVSVLQTTLRIR